MSISSTFMSQIAKNYPPPLSCPTPGRTVPRHPLGDGCQVTPPPPPSCPLGNHTTTIHAHFQAQKLHCKTKVYSGRTVLPSCSLEMRRYASPCSEYPTTCAKTGSPVERMNITFVPGVNMVVLSSSIPAKVSKMSCKSTKDTSGSAPQHSHPHNNTVSRDKNFCVDQVTVPHPAPGEGQGVGQDKGGGGRCSA